jgi:hypothetical protein
MAHKSVAGDDVFGNGVKGCGGNMMAGDHGPARIAPKGRLRSIVASLRQYLSMTRG